jgi:hypothetical protein
MKNLGTVAAPIYASAPTTLVTFDCFSNGGAPHAGLIANANGDLFGTTDSTVFELKNTGTVAAPVYLQQEKLAAFANTASRPRHCCFEHPRVCGGGDGRRWTTARL